MKYCKKWLKSFLKKNLDVSFDIVHISGKGYQHKDQDFKRLSQQVGAPRFCNSIESYQQRANYEYYCTKCHAKYIRIRKVDTNRMRCGHCNGKLRMKRQLK